MRPQTDRAQAANIRTLSAMVAPLDVRVVIEELRARDWASLTLTGARHELDLRLDGPRAGEALALISPALPQAEIAIPGQILAELVVEPGTADDVGHALTLCALVINE